MGKGRLFWMLTLPRTRHLLTVVSPHLKFCPVSLCRHNFFPMLFTRLSSFSRSPTVRLQSLRTPWVWLCDPLAADGGITTVQVAILTTKHPQHCTSTEPEAFKPSCLSFWPVDLRHYTSWDLKSHMTQTLYTCYIYIFLYMHTIYKPRIRIHYSCYMQILYTHYTYIHIIHMQHLYTNYTQYICYIHTTHMHTIYTVCISTLYMYICTYYSHTICLLVYL